MKPNNKLKEYLDGSKQQNSQTATQYKTAIRAFGEIREEMDKLAQQLSSRVKWFNMGYHSSLEIDDVILEVNWANGNDLVATIRNYKSVLHKDTYSYHEAKGIWIKSDHEFTSEQVRDHLIDALITQL